MSYIAEQLRVALPTDTESPALRHKMDHLVCFFPGVLALGAHNGAGVPSIKIRDKVFRAYTRALDEAEGVVPAAEEEVEEVVEEAVDEVVVGEVTLDGSCDATVASSTTSEGPAATTQVTIPTWRVCVCTIR